MASRENTTIQVALILSVMTTITLAVFTYMFHAKAKTASESAAAVQNQLNDAVNKHNISQTEIKALKYMVGDSAVERGQVDSEISSYNQGGDLN